MLAEKQHTTAKLKKTNPCTPIDAYPNIHMHTHTHTHTHTHMHTAPESYHRRNFSVPDIESLWIISFEFMSPKSLSCLTQLDVLNMDLLNDHHLHVFHTVVLILKVFCHQGFSSPTAVLRICRGPHIGTCCITYTNVRSVGVEAPACCLPRLSLILYISAACTVDQIDDVGTFAAHCVPDSIAGACPYTGKGVAVFEV